MATFTAIFGQETAIEALRRALDSGRLPGTYLFTGTPGVGKMALAQAAAQAAACLTPHRSPFDACGVCESCRRAESGAHPEIITVRPQGEQMQIGQFWDRDGRQAPGILSRTLLYGPAIGKRRTYILEQADRLTESAANSLLKVLEEPPPYALFILLAPHPARVLPTIVSRSQIVRLRAVPTGELAAYLQDTRKISAERAGMLAAYSEGRIGQAVTLAGSPAVAEEITRILDFAEGLPNAPHYRALKAAEQLRKLAAQTKALVGEEPEENDGGNGPEEAGAPKEKVGRRQYAAVFDLLVTFYRDLLALSVGANEKGLVNRERIPAFSRLARVGSAGRWMACLDAILLARRRLDANANITMVTEALAMKLLQ